MEPGSSLPLEAATLTRIQQWSQGDFVLETLPILWGFEQGRPLTEVAKALAEESEPIMGMATAVESFPGLVVISQTCDILRDPAKRPFVQVAPIVQVATEDRDLIRLRMYPRFALIPALSNRCLVADLDRVFTVEKAFLAMWERTPGCMDAEQRQSFTETIRRFYYRPALPDGFNNGIRKLAAWFRDKHDRLPASGYQGFHAATCLQALAMVLVRPFPHWEALPLHVDFILIRQSEDDGIPATDWERFRETCEGKVSCSPEFTATWHEPACLGHLSAKEYLACDLLDLGHLSDATRRR